jgi:hypothetical protein
MAVTMNDDVFWDVTPCGSCMKFLRSVRWLLVMANVPSSPILVTLMMGAPHGVTSQKTPFFKIILLVPFLPEVST